MANKTINYFTAVAFIILIITQSVIAQTGSIEGKVVDKSNSEPLIGTTVIINGTTIGTISAADGSFKLPNLPPGVYRLTITYVSYSPKSVEEVKVEADKVTVVNIGLEENVVTLGDVKVSAIRKRETEISMIDDIKAIPFVATGISGQQISKTLDKDASEVIKRVPGITIIDNRFLVVRGLSQRYNNVWLNNAATPSTEADIRAFSFDVIPSSMIANMMIFKAPSAEFPADFSGGFVKITTKNMPDENDFTLSYSTGINGGTTFGKTYIPEAGKTDWLGFDNGFRALPEEMPAHLKEYELASNPAVQEKITFLGQKLNNNWLPVSSSALPDQKLQAVLSRKFNIGKTMLGNILALNYSLTNESDEILNNDYSIYDYQGDRSSFQNQFTDKQYSQSGRISLMNNTVLYAGDKNRIELRNFFNQSGTSRYIERTGREWYNDGRFIKSDELRYQSRSIYTGQLAGDHSFNSEKSRVDWTLGLAASNKKEPDTKRYRYIRDEADPTRYMLLFSDQADLASQSRMWIMLYENTISAAINYTHQFNPKGFNPEIKAGIYFEDKERRFDARNFGYAKSSLQSSFGQTILPVNEVFTNENINLTEGIKLMEITALSDSYKASNKQIAGYLSGKIPVGDRFNLYAGLRMEKNRQTLSSYKQASTEKVDVDRDTINLFPSTNLTWNLSEKSLFRFAYGMTINRPEFREIAPFYYVDFDMNAGIYGAPHIKQAYIQNFDLRYEFYPDAAEAFNIGLFYKKFLDPIEQKIYGNNPTQYSFDNVESAYSIGLEAEIRKSLDFIAALKNISIVMNSSVIKSRVIFPDGELSRTRPLEGQSPYIVNTGLFYNSKNYGLMVSLMYNVTGKRIVAVGRPQTNQWDDIPDIYEMPRNVIDLTFTKTITRNIEIKGGIKDLLNEKVEYMQTINATVDMGVYTSGAQSGTREFKHNQYTRTFNPGRYFSLGISLKL